ncbi:MAG: amidohydrolase [Paludibacteraceae bacterium]|nr:amidohydrolase [Paludibacteraceae bacterium]
MKTSITPYLVCLLVVFLAGCKEHTPAPQPDSTLIVYGTIYTAENNTMAQAMVIRDGKYVFVGDSVGAEAYRTPDTKCIHHHSGMVMPSCTDGHAHYTMGTSLQLMGLDIDNNADREAGMQQLTAFYQKTKQQGKNNIYGHGWNFFYWCDNLPTRQDLDRICPDVAVYMNDSEGHKGLANTLCLQRAGILDKDGKLLISSIPGGEIVMGDDQLPTGLLKEQAGTYVRSHGIDFNELLTPEVAQQTFELLQQRILANGYTIYMDGWSNYFSNDAYYQVAKQMDKRGDLHLNIGLSYEIESWCPDIEKAVQEAERWQSQFSSKHVHPDYFKLFMDGTVETFTGFVIGEYATGGHGIANWSEEDIAAITRYANSRGISMHIHTMGDAAVQRVVNAYASAGIKDMRNSLVHVRNVTPEDFQRIADNNICIDAGMHWHSVPDLARDTLKKALPTNLAGKSYPMKSFFDKGVHITSHTDYPATSGSPEDPFGIMEIAITGMYQQEGLPSTTPWDPDELISREQFLQAITINGAYQLHLEKERGSIAVGKYADFILIDQNVLRCETQNIHNTHVLATYFEGQQVYPL